MWFGKLAIITYVFSAVLFFVGYMMQQGLGVTIFVGATKDYLETLTGENNVELEGNPQLIFGNYIGGLTAIAGLIFNSVTGGVVADAFQGLPGGIVNEPVMLLIRFLFTFSTAMLGISILTGREL